MSDLLFAALFFYCVGLFILGLIVLFISFLTWLDYEIENTSYFKYLTRGTLRTIKAITYVLSRLF